jgi:hypothetical protein
MNNNLNDNECIICLDNYDINLNNLVFFTPECGCRVTTHYKCAELWINKNLKCPICASNIKITDMFSNNPKFFLNSNNNLDINNQLITYNDNDIVLNIDLPYNNNNNNNHDNDSTYCVYRKKEILIILLFTLFIIVFIFIITSF